MISLKGLVNPKKPVNESGFEYIVFELYRHTLEKIFDRTSVDEDKNQWLTLWNLQEQDTLEDIKQQLSKLTPTEDPDDDTLVGGRNVYSSNDEAPKLYFVLDTMKFGSYGKVEFHKLHLVTNHDDSGTSYCLDNVTEYEAWYGKDTVINVVNMLQEYKEYTKNVIKILAKAYEYIVEKMLPNDQVANFLTGKGHHLEEAQSNTLFFERMATVEVAKKSVIANLHSRIDFAFTKIDLGCGELVFPLDLNDLDNINTANFNARYPVDYNPRTKTGAAEKHILGPLGILSLQQKALMAAQAAGVRPAAIKTYFTSDSGGASSPSPKKGKPPTPTSSRLGSPTHLQLSSTPPTQMYAGNRIGSSSAPGSPTIHRKTSLLSMMFSRPEPQSPPPPPMPSVVHVAIGNNNGSGLRRSRSLGLTNKE